jgi:hypothetical protein
MTNQARNSTGINPCSVLAHEVHRRGADEEEVEIRDRRAEQMLLRGGERDQRGECDERDGERQDQPARPLGTGARVAVVEAGALN